MITSEHTDLNKAMCMFRTIMAYSLWICAFWVFVSQRRGRQDILPGCYLALMLLYSSSVTGHDHTVGLLSVFRQMAMWANSLLGPATCQCVTTRRISITSVRYDLWTPVFSLFPDGKVNLLWSVHSNDGIHISEHILPDQNAPVIKCKFLNRLFHCWFQPIFADGL